MSNKRTQILDAAAELIAAKGFVQTSVDDVIASAGLSGKSHFYHYFKSKETLGHEVLARQFDELADRVLILREGKVAAFDSPTELRRQAGNVTLAEALEKLVNTNVVEHLDAYFRDR